MSHDHTSESVPASLEAPHHEEGLRQRRGILWSLLDNSAPHGILEEAPFSASEKASYPPNMGSTCHLSPMSPVPQRHPPHVP